MGKVVGAVVENEIVGFAEFESNGYIDCFFCRLNLAQKFAPTAHIAGFIFKIQNGDFSIPS